MIFQYINPISRLGLGKYSYVFPIWQTLLFLLCLEVFIRIPFTLIGLGAFFIILFSIAQIIYSAFRDGIRGGVIAAILIPLYYAYLVLVIQSPHQRTTGLISTLFFLVVYFILAITIGWLKQSLDKLIIKEKIAAQRAEEESLRFQSVLQQMPIAVRIANLKENKIEVNKKLEEMLSQKVPTDFDSANRYFAEHEYKNGKKLQVKDTALLKVIKSGRKAVYEEIEYIRDDKKHLFLKISAAPVFNKNKQLISVVSTLFDITAEREQDKRKDDFISMASHELKTPITSMSLYLDLIIKRAKEMGDGSLTSPLQNLRAQIDRLQELVSDMLDISRIQTGKLNFSKQRFSISDLTYEVCELFQEVRRDKKIIVKIPRPVSVYGDRFRIYQVLSNLLTNALKYSDGAQEIIVQVQASHGNAVVSVQDFGIGIASHQQKKVFDLLYQINDPQLQTFPGLGMGLFISKSIIKKHRGKIWVDSEKGKGSTFYFTVPQKAYN